MQPGTDHPGCLMGSDEFQRGDSEPAAVAAGVTAGAGRGPPRRAACPSFPAPSSRKWMANCLNPHAGAGGPRFDGLGDSLPAPARVPHMGIRQHPGARRG